jgi:hypothetical protein
MQIDYNLESKSDEEKISHTAHSLEKNLIFHNQLCVSCILEVAEPHLDRLTLPLLLLCLQHSLNGSERALEIFKLGP